MTIQKGDTLYRTENGEPSQVERITKQRAGTYHGGQVKVTMSSGDYFYLAVVPPERGSPLPSRYSLTQTPELALKWAKELQAREDSRAAIVARFETERLTRLANRDAINAPATCSAPEVRTGDDGEPNEVRITVTTTEATRAGEVKEYARNYAASVFQQSRKNVGDDGEWDYVREWGVNWSAMGTTSPEIARAYALAILAAADLADARNATPAETLTDA